MEVQENITSVQENRTQETAAEAAVQKIKTVNQAGSNSVQPNETCVQKNQTVPSPAEINAKNAAESTGRVADDGGAAVFFTADQVRAMTPAQVKANYPRIVESMKCRTFFG